MSRPALEKTAIKFLAGTFKAGDFAVGETIGAYLAQGERERALDKLENAFAVRDPLLIWSSTDPGIDPLRNEKRFIEIELRINNYAA